MSDEGSSGSGLDFLDRPTLWYSGLDHKRASLDLTSKVDDDLEPIVRGTMRKVRWSMTFRKVLSLRPSLVLAFALVLGVVAVLAQVGLGASTGKRASAAQALKIIYVANGPDGTVSVLDVDAGFAPVVAPIRIEAPPTALIVKP